MGKIKLKVIVLFLFSSIISQEGFASSIENNQVQSQYRILMQIEKKLKEYETKLSKENQRYIQVSKNKKDIDLKCIDLEKGLNDAQSRYNEKLLLTQKLLGQNMLNDMNIEETSADILQRRLYQKKLVLEIENLKKQSEVNKSLKDTLVTLRNRFTELTKLEEEIGGILNNLEKDKKDLALSYVKQEQETSALKNQVKEIKSETTPKFSPKSDILIPIAKYTEVSTKSKKGIIVKYDGTQDILSPLEGKVIYTGMLSTYGRVLMIDHGNELRSVILGDNNYYVNKGSTVFKGQKIGLAKKSFEGQGKIYFELRKNNQVQNTFNVLSSPNALGLFAKGNGQIEAKNNKSIEL